VSGDFYNSKVTRIQAAGLHARRLLLQKQFFGGAGAIACALFVVVLIAFDSVASAQNMYSGGGGIMAPSAKVRPPGLNHVGIEQRLNQQVPADLAFRDETGKPVKLGDYFGRRPLILSLVYFRCPMLCSEVLAGVERSRPLALTRGKTSTC
jgi:protein SCO1/2